MEDACTTLTEVVRSTRQFKINGFSMTWGMSNDSYAKSRWNVGGYDWEVRIYPHYGKVSAPSSVALDIIFLGEEARAFGVRTIITVCLVDPEAILKPSMEIRRSATFRKPQDSSSEVLLMPGYELEASPYIKDDSFTVQCTLQVLKELPDIPQVHIQVPPSNLHRHFAELLWNGMGADVTFLVSGESFAAHKHILAVRSPVFKAEFLVDMIEKGSPSVEIKDVEVAAFKALLHFIYTDSVPEFEQREEAEAVTLMAQHLLAAADRYGLDRLKLICADELSGGINVDTAATTLALAEQHNCPQLKTKCVDYITTTSATLDAVLATEGYKHLEASCPLVVIDLLRCARGSRI